jgi:hypothetical protein
MVTRTRRMKCKLWRIKKGKKNKDDWEDNERMVSFASRELFIS